MIFWGLDKNTNKHSYHKNGTYFNPNLKDIEKVISMFQKMGLLQMSGVCMYKETLSDVTPHTTDSDLCWHITFSKQLDSRGKPHLWGLDKCWVRTGNSRMICDLTVFQGSVNRIPSKFKLILSGDVVMNLASTLPEGQNYKIYAEQY